MAPAIVEPQGYAQPTNTSNPPESFAQALAVAQIRDGERTSPDRIVLGLFARGYPVPLDQLRQAFHCRFIEPIRMLVEELSEGGSSIDEVVDAIATGTTALAPRSKSGRFMIRHAKNRDDSAMSIVESANALLATAMLGGDVSTFDLEGADAFDELMDVTSLGGFADDRVEGVGAIVRGGRQELRADLTSIFRSISVEALGELMQSASLEELTTSRNMLKQVLTFGEAFARNVPDLGGPRTAFGMEFLLTLAMDDESIVFLSVMLLSQIRRLGQAQVDASFVELTPSFEAQPAMRQLLDELPVELHRYFSTDSLRRGESPSPSESETIATTIAALEARIPGFTNILLKAADLTQHQ